MVGTLAGAAWVQLTQVTALTARPGAIFVWMCQADAHRVAARPTRCSVIPEQRITRGQPASLPVISVAGILTGAV